jgi:hypothetical protein
MDRTNPLTSRSNPTGRRFRLALMWRGDPRAPDQPTSHPARLAPLVAALEDERIESRPVVYFDEAIGAARETLLTCDGVLVWINPLQDGLYDRSKVDPLLREIASAGVWVSAHPDAILKMGTKEVLYRTRELGWGSDTDLYRYFDEFGLRFPVKLSIAGARVLKPLRGNDGRGVLKVELAPGRRDAVRVQAASDDRIETVELAAFIERMRPAFDAGGLIDQAFHPNIAAGMVRCYMSQDRVAGFSEQAPRNSAPSAATPALGMNSAKAMHPADVEKFQSLRKSMEQDWTPRMQRLLDLPTASLPALWDADFLYRSEEDVGASPYALCEINVSSVLPFPDAAAPTIAQTVGNSLAAR